MADRPPLHSVPNCGPEEMRDLGWMENLQRHGEVCPYLRHSRRDFGPVPADGAQILRMADYRPKGGAA